MFSKPFIEALGVQLGPETANVFRVAAVPVTVDPLALVRSGAHLFPFAAYFGRPDADEAGGLGAAWRSEATDGPGRFGEISSQLSQCGIDPRAFVGFSYRPEGGLGTEWDGFSPAVSVIPVVSVIGTRESAELVVVLPPGRSWGPVAEVLSQLSDPGPPATGRTTDLSIESRPAPTEWEGAVANAVDSIRAGLFEKVVMARSVLVTSDVPYRPFDLVSRLRMTYPECYVFGWQQGDRVFVGASPELLVERVGTRVRSHPLAGSAPRGSNEEEDRAFGELLMSSGKDRREHRFVVDDITERLGPLTTSLHVDHVPSLRKTTHVQHLSTEVRGDLVDSIHVFDLAGTLHPTPAVGGSPRDEADRFLAKEELIDRGWYAGGIGWANRKGDGELAISLRCALIQGRTALLYAGAGIVADSNPAAELEETRLKFRTMMSLLAES